MDFESLVGRGVINAVGKRNHGAVNRLRNNAVLRAKYRMAQDFARLASARVKTVLLAALLNTRELLRRPHFNLAGGSVLGEGFNQLWEDSWRYQLMGCGFSTSELLAMEEATALSIESVIWFGVQSALVAGVDDVVPSNRRSS